MRRLNITILFILFVFMFIIKLANSDMNAATPQAASFSVVDKGSPGQGGDLVLPISLLNIPGRNGLNAGISVVYSSNDNTLRKESSEVGFGFSFGAGSAITRSVRGVPDDLRNIHRRDYFDCFGEPFGEPRSVQESGIMFDPMPREFSEKMTPFVSSCGSRPDTLTGVYRSNPDSFFVSINGQGNEMIFDKNTNEFKLVSVQPWVIKYNYDLSGVNGISEFVITTEDGTNYVFRDIGIKTGSQQTVCKTTLEFGPNQFRCFTGPNDIVYLDSTNRPYTYAWPLVEIRSNNYKDLSGDGPSEDDFGNWIKYNYDVSGLIISSNVGGFTIVPRDFYFNYDPYSVHFDNSYSINSFAINDYRLSSIETPLYHADLSYSNRDAYDNYLPPTGILAPSRSNTPRGELKKLDSIDLYQNVPGAQPLKTIRFSYYHPNDPSGDKRILNKLTLKEIQEFGIDEIESIPATKFTYSYATRGCGGSGLLGENLFGLCSTDPTAFLLKTITYPTGGKAEYVFESENAMFYQDIDLIDPAYIGVPSGLPYPDAYKNFIDIGTRLKQINFQYGAGGDVTTTNFNYFGGVVNSNPNCEKKYTYGSDELIPGANPSLKCIERDSIPLPIAGLDDSDISPGYVNSVVYPEIWTYTEPYADNGWIRNFYTTTQDYPNRCNRNGNCLTVLGYQTGRLIKSKYYEASGSGPFPFPTSLREDYYRFSLDNTIENNGNLRDATLFLEYDDWISTSAHSQKINLYDWDHLDEINGFPVSPGFERLAPDDLYDVYSIASSANFLLKKQTADFNGHLISVIDFQYEDIPVAMTSFTGPNFNGIPINEREHLFDLECNNLRLQIPTLYMGGIYQPVAFNCLPIKSRLTENNFGFKTNSLLRAKNMKVQPGEVSVKEELFTYNPDSYTSKTESFSKLRWSAFNFAGETFPFTQVYPLTSESWVDRNSNDQLEDLEFSIVSYNDNSYDNWGNVLEVTDPIGTVSFVKYDDDFHSFPEKSWNSVLGSEVNPVILNQFDEFGNLKVTTDINQKITKFNYDSLGRLHEVVKTDDYDGLSEIPSQVISYSFAGENVGIGPGQELNFVETSNLLSRGVNMINSKSFADGGGRLLQISAIENSDFSIKSNSEYFENTKLKKSYKPFREANPGESLVFGDHPIEHRIPSVVIIPESTKQINMMIGINSDTANLLGILTPGTGNIQVTSSPGNVDVYLDSEVIKKGTTDINGNLLISGVNIGTHYLIGKKIGYEDKTIVGVDVTADQTTIVIFNLELIITNPGSFEFSYFNDPMLRIESIKNPDDTIIMNQYSAETRSTSINACGISNVNRDCKATRTVYYGLGSLQGSDQLCKTQYCPQYVQAQPNGVTSCQYSCTGQNSEGCPGDHIEGGIDCYLVDPSTYHDPVRRECVCNFYEYTGQGGLYYHDGLPISLNVNQEFLKTLTTDENSKTTESLLDTFGNLVEFKDSNNQLTKYEYDLLNRPISITNAKGQVTINEYDTLGRLTKIVNPDYGTINNVYDDNGNLISKNNNGFVTNYQYDGLNRIKLIMFLNGEPSITYEYDTCVGYSDSSMESDRDKNILGKLCRVDNGFTKKEITYDARGRVKKVNSIIDNKNYVVSYEYDYNDNVKAIIDPILLRTQYEYNNLNQVEQVIANGKTTKVAYNPEGTIKDILYGNNVLNAFTYTPRNFLQSYETTGIKNTILEEPIGEPAGTEFFTFKENLYYDNAGNIDSILKTKKTVTQLVGIPPRTRTETINTGFKYDDLYRLTKVFNPDNPQLNTKYFDSFSYGYDLVGNRLFENKFVYTYEPTPKENRLKQVKNDPYNSLVTDFSYDTRGNLIRKTQNKEYGICSIRYVTNVNGNFIVMALNEDLPTTSELLVVYDRNKFDDLTNLNLQNEHYEFKTFVQSNSDSQLTCNGQQATKLIALDLNKHIKDNLRRSDSSAELNTWYTSERLRHFFNVYDYSKKQTDNYYYDTENRLTRIDFGDGTCDHYQYDASGLRFKKNEKGKSTIYIYHGNNPIYEETLDEAMACGPAGPASFSIEPNFDILIPGTSCEYLRHSFNVVNNGASSGRAIPTVTVESFDLMEQVNGPLFTFNVAPSFQDIGPGSNAQFRADNDFNPLRGDYSYTMSISVDGNKVTSSIFRCQ